MKDLIYDAVIGQLMIKNLKILQDEITDNENSIANNYISLSTKPDIYQGTGAPASSLGSDKDLYIDDTGSAEKLYVKVNGTWMYTTLT